MPATISPPLPPTRPLVEYAALEHLLLGDLRELLEEPATPETRRWLLAVLDALLDLLPCEFALEEEGGYLSEVLEQFPNWSSEVDRLQRQHTIPHSQLRQLRDRITDRSPFAHTASDVQRQLREWMNRVTAHNRHENRLCQTALNLELGGGD